MLKELRVGTETLHIADEFCCFGGKITGDDQFRGDIECRMAMAREAFLKKRNLLTLNINLSVTEYFLKAFVWNVTLNESKMWMISSVDKKRTGAFECGVTEEW